MAAGVLTVLLLAFAVTLDSRWTGLTERVVAAAEALCPLAALLLTRGRPGRAQAQR